MACWSARAMATSVEALLEILADPQHEKLSRRASASLRSWTGARPNAEAARRVRGRPCARSPCGARADAQGAGDRDAGGDRRFAFRAHALITALSDEDLSVTLAARDGLRRISRRFGGFGLPDRPAAISRLPRQPTSGAPGTTFDLHPMRTSPAQSTSMSSAPTSRRAGGNAARECASRRTIAWRG